MALPNWVFVQEKKDGDGSVFLDASRAQGDTVEDDGTVQVVGTYKLIKKIKIRKQIQFVIPQRKKRAKR